MLRRSALTATAPPHKLPAHRGPPESLCMSVISVPGTPYPASIATWPAEPFRHNKRRIYDRPQGGTERPKCKPQPPMDTPARPSPSPAQMAQGAI